MKKLGFAQKLTALLAGCVAATLLAVLGLSYLVYSATSSAETIRHQAQSDREMASTLVEQAAAVQALAQKLVREKDIDTIESIIGQSEKLTRDAQARIRAAGGAAEGVETAFLRLARANEQVKASLLRAEHVVAQQLLIEQSNPAFEALLAGIQKFEKNATAELDKRAVSATTTNRWISTLIGLIVTGSLAGIVLLGISVQRGIVRKLNAVVERVKDIAEGQGDLTRRLEVTSNDELGQLAGWFNQFLDKLHEIMVQVNSNTHRLASATEELSASATQQSMGAETQQQQTTQVAAAMNEMACTVQQVSQSSNRAAQASRRAAETARQGGKVVEQTLEKMRAIATAVTETAGKVGNLGKSSNQIGEIVGVIDEIAEQTNLLALNAAIEAARAGAQGRGFAVVADEVRKLAERTSQATREIAVMIRTIQSETRNAVTAMETGTSFAAQGVQSTTDAGRSLQEIIRMAEEVGDMISQIATSASQQASATEQVSGNVEQIAKITREAAAGAHQSAASCHELSNLALDLQNLVTRFRLHSSNANGNHLRTLPVASERTVALFRR